MLKALIELGIILCFFNFCAIIAFLQAKYR